MNTTYAQGYPPDTVRQRRQVAAVEAMHGRDQQPDLLTPFNQTRNIHGQLVPRYGPAPHSQPQHQAPMGLARMQMQGQGGAGQGQGQNAGAAGSSEQGGQSADAQSNAAASASAAPPEMNLANVLHYLQSEWRRWERDRNEWEIERAEMRVSVTPLPCKVTGLIGTGPDSPSGGSETVGREPQGRSAPQGQDAGVRPSAGKVRPLSVQFYRRC